MPPVFNDPFVLAYKALQDCSTVTNHCAIASPKVVHIVKALLRILLYLSILKVLTSSRLTSFKEWILNICCAIWRKNVTPWPPKYVLMLSLTFTNSSRKITCVKTFCRLHKYVSMLRHAKTFYSKFNETRTILLEHISLPILVYCGVLSKWAFYQNESCLCCPILPWVMEEGESKKVALILMKNSFL